MPIIAARSTNVLNQYLLTLSAVITWAAIVVSEFFQLKGSNRIVFFSAAVVFIAGFLHETRRKNLGWSPALVAITVSSGIAVYIGAFGVTPALLVIGGVILFEKLPARQFLAVIAILNAVLLVKMLKAHDLVWALSGFSAYLGFQIFGNMMVSSSRAVDTANSELLRINAELIATRALLSESARAQERLSLSRELHDVCGHKLTALKLTLRGRGDVGALEGLTNAARHSNAHKVEIRLTQEHENELNSDSRALILSVSDDGNSNGGNSAKKLIRGNGLNGMAERLAALGGSLEIKQLAQGLCLAARLPLPANAPL